jgi:hypothetical protein
MIIGTNDDDTVWAAAGGPNKEGKFAGYIMFGERHRILISTEGVYDSEEEAKADMQSIINQCREHFA